MRMLLRSLSICVLASSAAARAQDNPMTGFDRMAYGYMKKNLLASAEKMPDESFGFRPAETVRTFGQILAHTADAQYMFCSAVLGEKAPAHDVEKTKTSKADIIAAMKDAFAYCDKAYDGMTDVAGNQRIKFFGKDDMPKQGILAGNAMHLSEHYGNVVTYLRIKGLVPPSSEHAPQAASKN